MPRSYAPHTPFPDLTGWRSSAAGRGGSTSRAVVVHDELKDLSVDTLRGVGARLKMHDAADLIVAAWTIVLVRLAS